MRALAGLVVATLALTGCAAVDSDAESSEATASPSATEETEQALPDLPKNIALRACAEYDYSESSFWLDAYELVIEDMCQFTDLDESVLEVRMGENIAGGGTEFFLDPLLQQLHYFDSFAEGGIDPVPIVVVNEFDREFWLANMEELLITEFEWFGLSDAGGHCGFRKEAEAYCPNIYIPGETASGGTVLSLFIGTEEIKYDHDTWRRSIPAHSAVHAVQYQKLMSHYTQWAIEGQALLHELVMQQLLRGETVRFSKYLPMSLNNDQLRVDPSSVESIKEHIDQCKKDGGQCLDFNSFAGSVYLEKLIADHGIQKYKDYFAKIWLRKDLGLEIAEYENEYAPRAFAEVYGFELDTWLDQQGVPYLRSVYEAAGY